MQQKAVLCSTAFSLPDFQAVNARRPGNSRQIARFPYCILLFFYYMSYL